MRQRHREIAGLEGRSERGGPLALLRLSEVRHHRVLVDGLDRLKRASSRLRRGGDLRRLRQTLQVLPHHDAVHAVQSAAHDLAVVQHDARVDPLTEVGDGVGQGALQSAQHGLRLVLGRWWREEGGRMRGLLSGRERNDGRSRERSWARRLVTTLMRSHRWSRERRWAKRRNG